jgi:hypothetical protein
MPIEPSDITTYLSGGSGNSNPFASLGGAVSSTDWTGGTIHDLFDRVTAPENVSEAVHYRCIYIVNEHDTLTWQGVNLWLVNIVVGGADVAIGLDPAGVNGTATTIANETEVPSGVTFSAPESIGAALSVGNIPAGGHQAVWIRRTATDSVALRNDGATLRWRGETAL